jgi:hypothetical protein
MGTDKAIPSINAGRSKKHESEQINGAKTGYIKSLLLKEVCKLSDEKQITYNNKGKNGKEEIKLL